MTDFEYIIIDGQSEDNTLAIIQSFESDFAAKSISYQWISESDKGIYDAFNKGVHRAKGDWISFVGSDDVLSKNYLLTLDDYLGDKKLDLVSFRASIMNRGEVIDEIGEAWKWNVFKKEMKVVHIGSIHHRDYFEKYGKFDEEYKIAGDYELLLRAGDDLKTGFLNESLVIMGDEGVSSTQVKLSLQEAKKAKIRNKVRNRFLVEVDYFWVLLKITLKEVLGR